MNGELIYCIKYSFVLDTASKRLTNVSYKCEDITSYIHLFKLSIVLPNSHLVINIYTNLQTSCYYIATHQPI